MYTQSTHPTLKKVRVPILDKLVKSLPLPAPYTHHTHTNTIRVVANGHVNKMLSTNCAIVFGPTIMRAEADSLEMATLMPVQNGIAEMFINEFDSIFLK